MENPCMDTMTIMVIIRPRRTNLYQFANKNPNTERKTCIHVLLLLLSLSLFVCIGVESVSRVDCMRRECGMERSERGGGAMWGVQMYRLLFFAPPQVVVWLHGWCRSKSIHVPLGGGAGSVHLQKQEGCRLFVVRPATTSGCAPRHRQRSYLWFRLMRRKSSLPSCRYGS